MSVKISGVLKDALGKPILNCIIRLTAIGTSATVIVTTRGESSPDVAGSYSMDVEPGDYRVMLIPDGWQPEIVGTIEVRNSSSAGSLNDFLTRAKKADLNEALMARFEKIAADIALDRQRAESSATAAADSKTAAKTSEDNAAASATAAAGSKNAAKTSEDNAAASATAAAGSKTAAKTSEDNAAASATAAAGSKTAAKTSEDNAAASATEAADSKTAAKTSEDNAAASATAAASSKTAAKTSEDNAEASAQKAATIAGSGRLLGVRKFEASGPYIPTPGTTRFIVELVGAGGGSPEIPPAPGGTVTGQYCSGSGGGATYIKALITPEPGDSWTMYVGAAPAEGGTGGNSMFLDDKNDIFLNSTGGAHGRAADIPPLKVPKSGAGGSIDPNTKPGTRPGKCLIMSHIAGEPGVDFFAGTHFIGAGGGSQLGRGGKTTGATWGYTAAPSGYGAGAYGQHASDITHTYPAVRATDGIIIITEYA